MVSGNKIRTEIFVLKIHARKYYGVFDTVVDYCKTHFGNHREVISFTSSFFANFFIPLVYVPSSLISP